MEFYQELTNMSDYYLSYDTFQSEECLDDGCEDEDEDVAMATYILELVLMPVFGAVGVLGNFLSITVLCKSVQKETTFHHVDMLFTCNSNLTTSCKSVHICMYIYHQNPKTSIQHLMMTNEGAHDQFSKISKNVI